MNLSVAARMAPILLLLALLSVSSPVGAAGPSYKDRVEDYLVRPGDTLRRITSNFLGNDDFWQENWRLNPQVRDPDLLRIGEPLRIIVQREVVAENARVDLAVNLAEKSLLAADWQHAGIGDELASGDALRTRAESVAVLRFNSGSTLRLNEFSQVFLKQKETSLKGVDRGAIEVLRGDVDVEFQAQAKARNATEIQMISGDSVTRPRPAADGSGQVRTGKSESGAARVMVFSGDSEVSAAGATVAVGSGMGTTVEQGKRPNPPEKLLGAPVTAALSWAYSNGILRWSAIDGAASYVVEVCSDPGCTTLEYRKRDLPGTAHQVQPLAQGSHYWRVFAVSRSGLDGYPSPVQSLLVSDARPDLEAPLLALQVVGAAVARPDRSTLLGADARLLALAVDSASGVERIEWRRGDAEWQPWDGLPLELPSAEVALSLRACDRLGQCTTERRYQRAAAAPPD